MSTDFGFKATTKVSNYYFVSYNTEDTDRVGEICKKLNSDYGVDIWYDEGLRHDEQWDAVIAERIYNCSEMIFFFTKNIFMKAKARVTEDNTFKKTDVWTFKEYQNARDYQKKILFVYLDDISINDVPFALVSWWQEIKPSNGIQGIISYDKPFDSTSISNNIANELFINKKDVLITLNALFKENNYSFVINHTIYEQLIEERFNIVKELLVPFLKEVGTIEINYDGFDFSDSEISHNTPHRNFRANLCQYYASTWENEFYDSAKIEILDDTLIRFSIFNEGKNITDYLKNDVISVGLNENEIEDHFSSALLLMKKDKDETKSLPPCIKSCSFGNGSCLMKFSRDN